MKFKNYLWVCFIIPVLLGCKETRKDEITRLVMEWNGKEIRFPEQTVYTKQVSDTIEWNIRDAEHKILIYVDSLGCTSCKLQLDKWKSLISLTDSMTNSTVPFLFYFDTKDVKEIKYLLRRDRFDYPICLDLNGDFNRLNNLPQDHAFQTFLLNKKNEIVLMGNPVLSPSVKDLYLKEIMEPKAE